MANVMLGSLSRSRDRQKIFVLAESIRRTRAADPQRHHAPPVEPFEQGLELGTRQPRHCADAGRRAQHHTGQPEAGECGRPDLAAAG